MIRILILIFVILLMGVVVVFYHAPDTTSDGITYYGRRGFPFVYAREWGDFGGQLIIANVALDLALWALSSLILIGLLHRKRYPRAGITARSELSRDLSTGKQ